jgi:hypothetical protein
MSVRFLSIEISWIPAIKIELKQVCKGSLRKMTTKLKEHF